MVENRVDLEWERIQTLVDAWRRYEPSVLFDLTTFAYFDVGGRLDAVALVETKRFGVHEIVRTSDDAAKRLAGIVRELASIRGLTVEEITMTSDLEYYVEKSWVRVLDKDGAAVGVAREYDRDVAVVAAYVDMLQKGSM